MKKMTFVFFSFFLLLSLSNAYSKCFLVLEGEKVIREEGDCDNRLPPCSTFNLAIALMGFDSGILKDSETPKWEYKKGYPDWLDSWKNSQTPRTWIKNSCVWYSQEITKKLGMKAFKKYVNLLNYGNKDVSGDLGKSNGLTNAWLSSSLKITPREQVEFLRLLTNYRLKINKSSVDKALSLFSEGDLSGYELFGKTGSGNVGKDKIGWFIGFLRKENKKDIIFAYVDKYKKMESIYYGHLSKEKALAGLKEILEGRKK